MSKKKKNKIPQTVQLCKIFNFETAHALLNYDGLCKNIHGHSYKLYVTVEGIPLQKENHPKDGMVMDFKDLKKIVKEKIVTPFDHALVLNKKTPKKVVRPLQAMYEKVVLTSYQPTCENMLLDFAKKISPSLPKGARLVHLKLYETETSYASINYE
ncbi:MAG TPA: 6-carboxytetrahydropterin synthase [Phaeodactylibacter sp.]|nr:6-carboxytetrahydropterin synthase [Phaeodactylibacter sp.]